MQWEVQKITQSFWRSRKVTNLGDLNIQLTQLQPNLLNKTFRALLLLQRSQGEMEAANLCINSSKTIALVQLSEKWPDLIYCLWGLKFSKGNEVLQHFLGTRVYSVISAEAVKTAGERVLIKVWNLSNCFSLISLYIALDSSKTITLMGIIKS